MKAVVRVIFVLCAVLAVASIENCLAGTPQKWEDVPKAVRDTVLANGGTPATVIDKEKGTRNGLAVYEAGIKGKDGAISDLVITEDGTLIETKIDDAEDQKAERAAGQKAAARREVQPSARNHQSVPAAGDAQTRHSRRRRRWPKGSRRTHRQARAA